MNFARHDLERDLAASSASPSTPSLTSSPMESRSPRLPAPAATPFPVGLFSASTPSRDADEAPSFSARIDDDDNRLLIADADFEDSATPGISLYEETAPPSVGVSFHCSFCFSRFSTKGEAEVHVAEAHQNLAEVVIERLDGNVVVAEVGAATPTPTTTPSTATAEIIHCGVNPAAAAAVAAISRSNRYTQRFICRLCDYSAASKKSLQKHVVTKHSDEFDQNSLNRREDKNAALKAGLKSSYAKLPFACNACDKRFHNEVGLRRHQQLSHRNLMCSICGEVFAASRYLWRHGELVHGGLLTSLASTSSENNSIELAPALEINSIEPVVIPAEIKFPKTQHRDVGSEADPRSLPERNVPLLNQTNLPQSVLNVAQHVARQVIQQASRQQSSTMSQASHELPSQTPAMQLPIISSVMSLNSKLATQPPPMSSSLQQRSSIRQNNQPLPINLPERPQISLARYPSFQQGTNQPQPLRISLAPFSNTNSTLANGCVRPLLTRAFPNSLQSQRPVQQQAAPNSLQNILQLRPPVQNFNQNRFQQIFRPLTVQQQRTQIRQSLLQPMRLPLQNSVQYQQQQHHAQLHNQPAPPSTSFPSVRSQSYQVFQVNPTRLPSGPTLQSARQPPPLQRLSVDPSTSGSDPCRRPSLSISGPQLRQMLQCPGMSLQLPRTTASATASCVAGPAASCVAWSAASSVAGPAASSVAGPAASAAPWQGLLAVASRPPVSNGPASIASASLPPASSDSAPGGVASTTDVAEGFYGGVDDADVILEDAEDSNPIQDVSSVVGPQKDAALVASGAAPASAAVAPVAFIRRPSAQQNQCLICESFFDDDDKLRVHFLSHVEEDSKECLLCGTEFESPVAMLSHFGKDHGGFEKHRCRFCEKTAYLKRSLNEHMKIHPPEEIQL